MAIYMRCLEGVEGQRALWLSEWGMVLVDVEIKIGESVFRLNRRHDQCLGLCEPQSNAE
jgi:hypothetical protein